MRLIFELLRQKSLRRDFFSEFVFGLHLCLRAIYILYLCSRVDDLTFEAESCLVPLALPFEEEPVLDLRLVRPRSLKGLVLTLLLLFVFSSLSMISTTPSSESD